MTERDDLMRRAIARGGVLALAVLAIAPSTASEPNQARDVTAGKPQAPWMDICDIAVKLERQGYLLREIEINGELYEVVVVDRQGVRLQARLDPKTGEPLRRWRRER